MPALSPDAFRRTLDLPPPYTLVTLRERGDAFAHACRVAGEAGAGTLVWVGRFDLIEFAVVLEPEEPLAGARRAFFAGMTALADAVGTHCPPEKEVSFDWPDALRFDGALMGGGRLGWPADCVEDEVPDWLVFSAQLVAAHVHTAEPGFLVATSLEEEAIADGDGRLVVESFARHLMVQFDRWSERGFAAVAQDYLARLPKRKAGERRAIEANGDLLFSSAVRPDATEPIPLLPALLQPSWLDPKTGGPRLTRC